jgi:hypothetical protein
MSDELVAPLNVAALIGEAVILSCRRLTQNIAWTFTPVNGLGGLVAVDCEPVAAVVEIYRIDSTNEACHLIIDMVTINLAGTYTCQDMSTNDKLVSAELIVLG